MNLGCKNQNLVNNLSFTASFGYQGNVIENISPDFIAKIEAIDSNTGEYVMSWRQLPILLKQRKRYP